jgi:ribosomal protein S18 acetylase RimI-like enzyme
VEIRRAEPGDLREVGEITVSAYEPYTNGPTDFYIERLRDAAARDREAELWVAVDDDGSILGSVTSTPEGSPWREIARVGEDEFRMLSVHPRAQGRGVGRALVQHLLDRATARGHRAVVMSSEASMAPAHGLYLSMGFERTPERDWHPLPHIDLITFSKEL